MSTALQLFEQFTDENKFNILRPTQAVMAVQNPLMTVYANVVKFDVEADSYPVDGGKRALFGRALSQVASGAGISFVNVTRLDDQRDSAVANVSVLAMMKRPDGTMIHTTGQKRVDARAYAEQKYGKDYAAKSDGVKFYNQLVKFVAERAETGAKSRAIRQLLAMKAAYTPAELAKPFVIPQIVVNMEAIVKTEFGMRLAIEQALGATAMLYGGNGNASSANSGNSPGMGNHAALPPAGGSVEDHPAPSVGEPAAAPAPAKPTADEIALDEWTNANGLERAQKLAALLAERDHGISAEAQKRAQDGDAATQAKAIVYLLAKPVKGANGQGAPQAPVAWQASEKQMKRLFAIAKNAGYDSDALHALVAERYKGIASLNDLTREQYDELTGSDTDGGYLAANPNRSKALPGNDNTDNLPF